MSSNPLLIRSPLLPGESLPSFIERLNKINKYEPPAIFFNLFEELGRHERMLLAYPQSSAFIKSVSDLTTIKLFELYQATAHRFAPVLTPPRKKIESLELSRDTIVPRLTRGSAILNLRPMHMVQFCPACLKESPYQRLIWLPRACAACLKHTCLFVDSCPECHSAVSFHDILESRCSRCRIDFAETQGFSVEDDSFGLFTQETIQTWLMGKDSTTTSHFPVLERTPGVIFYLLSRLRAFTIRIGQHWPHIGHTFSSHPTSRGFVAPSEEYSLYATAYKGLVDWPEGFHSFLTADRSQEEKSINPAPSPFYKDELISKLGSLYQYLQQEWSDSSFEVTHNTYTEWLITNHISVPSKTLFADQIPNIDGKLHYISRSEAARLLGISLDTLKHMIESGELASYQRQPNPSCTRVNREEVLRLRRKWGSVLNLEEAARELGLNESILPEMVRVGLLKAQKTHGETLYWRFKKSEVYKCLKRFTSVTKDYSSTTTATKKRWLNLREVSSLLSRKGSDIASILLEVAEGRLSAYVAQRIQFRLRNLLFIYSDMITYIENAKVEGD